MADESPRLPRLPVCLPGIRSDGPRLSARPITVLVALILLVLISLRVALTAWPDDGTVPATFRAAIVDLEDAADDLAPADEIAAGVTIRLLIERGRSVLHGLEGLPVPVGDAATLADLLIAEDAMRALAVGLQRQEPDTVGLKPLANEALRHLDRVEEMTSAWQEQLADSIVWLEDDDGRFRVWQLDRTLHDALRGLGIVLILAGCLGIGLRLLDRSRSRPTLGELWGAGPRTKLGLVVLATFLLGSVGLAVQPTLLPGVAPSLTALPRLGPCTRLDAARAAYRQADDLGIDALSVTVRNRVRRGVEDCLGLGSAVAARDAADRFLASAAETPSAPPAQDASVGTPSAAPLTLMPAMHDDVARLRASVDALLKEVADLRSEPVADEPHLNGAASEGGPAAPHEPPAGRATPAADAPTSQAPAEETAALEQPAPAPATKAPRPFVTTTAVNFRTGPSRSASRLGTLPEGTRVRMMSESDGWANVRLHDGRAAYVSRQFIRPVE